MMDEAWGAITHLADEYQLSRTFVYSLAGTLKDAGQFLFVEIKDLNEAPQSQRKAKPRLLDYFSTLSDYSTARHACQEAGIQCHGRQV